MFIIIGSSIHSVCNVYNMFFLFLNLTLNQLINQNQINRTKLQQQTNWKRNTPFSSTKIITNVIRPWGKIIKRKSVDDRYYSPLLLNKKENYKTNFHINAHLGVICCTLFIYSSYTNFFLLSSAWRKLIKLPQRLNDVFLIVSFPYIQYFFLFVNKRYIFPYIKKK